MHVDEREREGLLAAAARERGTNRRAARDGAGRSGRRRCRADSDRPRCSPGRRCTRIALCCSTGRAADRRHSRTDNAGLRLSRITSSWQTSLLGSHFLNRDQVEVLQHLDDDRHRFGVVELRFAEDLNVERRDADRVIAARRRRGGRRRVRPALHCPPGDS